VEVSADERDHDLLNGEPHALLFAELFDGGALVRAEPLVNTPEIKTGRITFPKNLHSGNAPRVHELVTMFRLTRLGFDVEFNEASRVIGVKTADITMEELLWEMKSPTGDSPHTLSANMRRAGKQADRLVLDLGRTALDSVASAAEVARRLAGSDRLVEAIVLFRDGSAPSSGLKCNSGDGLGVVGS
jgi:hypothetical protein